MRQAMTIIAIALSGCASPAQIEMQANEADYYRERIQQAAPNGIVRCDSTAQCDKAFRLAKLYVSDYSDMKVQISSDTEISTFNPLQAGRVSLSARRVPSAGQSETIELRYACRGMEDRGSGYMADGLYIRCAQRVAPILEGFRPYIEAKMR